MRATYKDAPLRTCRGPRPPASLPPGVIATKARPGATFPMSFRPGTGLTSAPRPGQLGHERREPADVRPAGGAPGAPCAVGGTCSPARARRDRRRPGGARLRGADCHALAPTRPLAQPVLRLRSGEQSGGRATATCDALLPGARLRRPDLSEHRGRGRGLAGRRPRGPARWRVRDQRLGLALGDEHAARAGGAARPGRPLLRWDQGERRAQRLSCDGRPRRGRRRSDRLCGPRAARPPPAGRTARHAAACPDGERRS
jgi:hypothetical protein